MLERYFNELNQEHFGSILPKPAFILNSRLRSTAGRFIPGSHNPLFPRIAQIELAQYLLEIENAEHHVRETILHEMIHYYLWFQRKPYGHTEEFLTIMKRVGARRYNPVPQQRPIKYWYECPHCLVKVPARKKMGLVACAPCCDKFNKGEFSERFQFRATLPPKTQEASSSKTNRATSTENHSASDTKWNQGGVNIHETTNCCGKEFPQTKANTEATPYPILSPTEIIRRLEELKRLVIEKRFIK